MGGREGGCITNSLWAHNWNLVKILFVLILILMIQSGHNYAHVMTAQLSWHVQNYDLNAFFVNTLQQPVFYFDLDYHNINPSWNGNRDTTGLLSHPLCPLTRKWPATERCQLTRIHHIVNSSQASFIITGPWPWVTPPQTCNRHTCTTPASLHLGLQSLLGWWLGEVQQHSS